MFYKKVSRKFLQRSGRVKKAASPSDPDWQFSDSSNCTKHFAFYCTSITKRRYRSRFHASSRALVIVPNRFSPTRNRCFPFLKGELWFCFWIATRARSIDGKKLSYLRSWRGMGKLLNFRGSFIALLPICFELCSVSSQQEDMKFVR